MPEIGALPLRSTIGALDPVPDDWYTPSMLVDCCARLARNLGSRKLLDWPRFDTITHDRASPTWTKYALAASRRRFPLTGFMLATFRRCFPLARPMLAGGPHRNT
ncbi:hypothetical protein Poly59_30530 [Rubripirellula reticaptiva]|uniref:Uncharacterized protein n=1 Tax=Rubripirellula reticaptiva TaxID=2528013 RepID=A0A5C6EW56_9BACT|nr:hypothetical protein Poly59_30530 [Rubripirellula reticaptiva]